MTEEPIKPSIEKPAPLDAYISANYSNNFLFQERLKVIANHVSIEINNLNETKDSAILSDQKFKEKFKNECNKQLVEEQKSADVCYGIFGTTILIVFGGGIGNYFFSDKGLLSHANITNEALAKTLYEKIFDASSTTEMSLTILVTGVALLTVMATLSLCYTIAKKKEEIVAFLYAVQQNKRFWAEFPHPLAPTSTSPSAAPFILLTNTFPATKSLELPTTNTTEEISPLLEHKNGPGNQDSIPSQNPPPSLTILSEPEEKKTQDDSEITMDFEKEIEKYKILFCEKPHIFYSSKKYKENYKNFFDDFLKLSPKNQAEILNNYANKFIINATQLSETFKKIINENLEKFFNILNEFLNMDASKRNSFLCDFITENMSEFLKNTNKSIILEKIVDNNILLENILSKWAVDNKYGRNIFNLLDNLYKNNSNKWEIFINSAIKVADDKKNTRFIELYINYLINKKNIDSAVWIIKNLLHNENYECLEKNFLQIKEKNPIYFEIILKKLFFDNTPVFQKNIKEFISILKKPDESKSETNLIDFFIEQQCAQFDLEVKGASAKTIADKLAEFILLPKPIDTNITMACHFLLYSTITQEFDYYEKIIDQLLHHHLQAISLIMTQLNHPPLPPASALQYFKEQGIISNLFVQGRWNATQAAIVAKLVTGKKEEVAKNIDILVKNKVFSLIPFIFDHYKNSLNQLIEFMIENHPETAKILVQKMVRKYPIIAHYYVNYFSNKMTLAEIAKFLVHCSVENNLPYVVLYYLENSMESQEIIKKIVHVTSQERLDCFMKKNPPYHIVSIHFQARAAEKYAKLAAVNQQEITDRSLSGYAAEKSSAAFFRNPSKNRKMDKLNNAISDLNSLQIIAEEKSSNPEALLIAIEKSLQSLAPINPLLHPPSNKESVYYQMMQIKKQEITEIDKENLIGLCKEIKKLCEEKIKNLDASTAQIEGQAKVQFTMDTSPIENSFLASPS